MEPKQELTFGRLQAMIRPTRISIPSPDLTACTRVLEVLGHANPESVTKTVDAWLNERRGEAVLSGVFKGSPEILDKSHSKAPWSAILAVRGVVFAYTETGGYIDAGETVHLQSKDAAYSVMIHKNHLEDGDSREATYPYTVSIDFLPSASGDESWRVCNLLRSPSTYSRSLLTGLRTPLRDWKGEPILFSPPDFSMVFQGRPSGKPCWRVSSVTLLDMSDDHLRRLADSFSNRTLGTGIKTGFFSQMRNYIAKPHLGLQEFTVGLRSGLGSDGIGKDKVIGSFDLDLATVNLPQGSRPLPRSLSFMVNSDESPTGEVLGTIGSKFPDEAFHRVVRQRDGTFAPTDDSPGFDTPALKLSFWPNNAPGIDDQRQSAVDAIFGAFGCKNAFGTMLKEVQRAYGNKQVADGFRVGAVLTQDCPLTAVLEWSAA